MNKGLEEYMILFRVMQDDEKFSQLLQNIVNFYEKHTKPLKPFFEEKK